MGNIVGEGGGHLPNHVRASLLPPKHILKCSEVFLHTLEALARFGGWPSTLTYYGPHKRDLRFFSQKILDFMSAVAENRDLLFYLWIVVVSIHDASRGRASMIIFFRPPSAAIWEPPPPLSPHFILKFPRISSASSLDPQISPKHLVLLSWILIFSRNTQCFFPELFDLQQIPSPFSLTSK